MGPKFWLVLASASLFIVEARRQRVLASLDIPETSFSCSGRPIGYYADVETDCQVYHMCGERGEQFSYACPNTTLFHQRMLVCAHWYQVNCSRTEESYGANLLIGQKDKPFSDSASGGLETASQLPTFQERSGKAPDLQTSPSFVGLNNYNSFRVKSGKRAKAISTTESTTRFRPTNVSFRSTIETPNSELGFARTAPMTSSSGAQQGTRSPFQSTVTHLTSPKPSTNLLPPLEDTNTIELRFSDPRAALFIPSSQSESTLVEPIFVQIDLKGHKSRFRSKSSGSQSTKCPRCHPTFLVDTVNCSPCLIVR